MVMIVVGFTKIKDL